MNLDVNSANPYNFFSMDANINIKSKQIGTADYDEILKYRVPTVISRLDSQLEKIEDKHSEEYLNTLKLKEELVEASTKIPNKDDTNILVAKDMPKIIDLFVLSRVSNLIELVKCELNGKKKVIQSAMYINPHEEIEEMLSKVNSDIEEYENSDLMVEKTSNKYNNLLKYKEFLERMDTAYEKIATAKDRDLLDVKFLNEGKFKQSDLDRWKILPDINSFEEKDRIISEKLSHELNEVLLRSNVKDCVFTKNTTDPYEMILRKIERFRNSMGRKSMEAPYKWQIFMSRQPKVIYTGKDETGAEILAYGYGKYICQSMFLPPTPKNPDGRPVYNTDKDIVGVTRIEKNGERNDHLVLFSEAEILSRKVDTQFLANIYFSKELMDAVEKNNYSYLGDIYKARTEEIDPNATYGNYIIEYNDINDDQVVSSLRLGYSNFSEAIDKKMIHRKPLIKDEDPYVEYLNIQENMANGQLIEIKDGKFFSHKKQVELPEMMERIESYHKQIVSKILEDRQLKHEKQNNKNSKILQFTDYAGHDSNDEPGEK